jgi:hypothetical protein
MVTKRVKSRQRGFFLKKFQNREIKLERLILAQNERWRPA